jgi:hypothetical protein
MDFFVSKDKYKNPHDDPEYHFRLDIDFNNIMTRLKISFHYLKSISISSNDFIDSHYYDKCIYKFTRLTFSKEKQLFGLPDYEELEYIDFYYNTDNIYCEKYKNYVKHFDKDTKTLHKMSYVNEKNQIHTTIPDKPALFTFYKNEMVECIYFFKNDKLHCDNGPAIIHYDEHSEIIGNYYFQDGLLHNERGPAVIKMKHYYKENSNDSYHTEDISESYFYKGVRHNTERPSYIDHQNKDNDKYYVNGIELTIHEFYSLDDKLKSYNEYNIPSCVKLNHLYD